MKILIQYIKPYKGLVLLAFLLAAINQTFSLFDPMIFGKLIDQFAKSPFTNLDGTVRTEAELVTKYREMALQPECDSAVDEIINESMSIDEKQIVKIDLDQF